MPLNNGSMHGIYDQYTESGDVIEIVNAYIIGNKQLEFSILMLVAGGILTGFSLSQLRSKYETV